MRMNVRPTKALRMSGGGGRGRGEYFKNRYGGRGRGGRTSQANGATNHDWDVPPIGPGGTGHWNQLPNVLSQIDRQQYGAYKRLLGIFTHDGPDFTLSVDHVQGDPYAPPSRVRAIMPWLTTGFPSEYLSSDIRRNALCDFVTRVAADFIRMKQMGRNVSGGGGWSGPKGGAFNINATGQEILPRTSAMIDGDQTIELRFTVSLPAAGRNILGQQAWQILGVNLPQLVDQTLLHLNLDQARLQQHVYSVERQYFMRARLSGLGLISFIANGSILPRSSGANSLPMDASSAVPFKAPKEAEVTMQLPDGDSITGMGIPKGITMLTGGGFHGKSTLLEAIELGIYDHVPGDGRELIVTDPTAVKIRAEDGRSVAGVDISPFISNLPGGRDTRRFSTDDASGSTSMASNIQEALEAGCKTLLIDEDSSATNLLVRDQRMQKLIKKEPITPLISKARSLYSDQGVSTIIVIGGLGDWLSVSDNVISMDSYTPRIITSWAKAVIKEFPTHVTEDQTYGSLPDRKFKIDFENSKFAYATRKNFIGLKAQDRNPVNDPAEAEPGIDLTGLDQVVEVGQARMIAKLIESIAIETRTQSLDLATLLQKLEDRIGVDKCLPTSLSGDGLVAVRRFELAAAMSRLRGLLAVT